MVPDVICTVCPVEIAVALIVMSVPEVPTVRPLTITVPALLRNSARAAVPVALAVAESGVPDNVNTDPETIPGVALSVIVANTPVAPESALVPMTSDPAVAAPVEEAAVLDAIKSATNCIRLVLSVAA